MAKIAPKITLLSYFLHLAHTLNPPSMTFAVEVGRLTTCSPQGYRPTHRELPTGNCLMHDEKQALTGGERKFHNSCMWFHYSEKYKCQAICHFLYHCTSLLLCNSSTSRNSYKRKQEVPLQHTSILLLFTSSPHISSPFSPSRCGHTAILLSSPLSRVFMRPWLHFPTPPQPSASL